MGKRRYGSRQSFGPKRNVIKSIFIHLNAQVNNVQENVGVFTADVDCTLVRTIIEMNYVMSVLGDAKLLFKYERRPNAKEVGPTLSIASGEVTGLPDEVILFGGIYANRETHDTVASRDSYNPAITKFYDLKSMRKLQKGDQLVFSEISDVGALFSAFHIFTMFFKET